MRRILSILCKKETLRKYCFGLRNGMHSHSYSQNLLEMKKFSTRRHGKSKKHQKRTRKVKRGGGGCFGGLCSWNKVPVPEEPYDPKKFQDLIKSTQNMLNKMKAERAPEEAARQKAINNMLASSRKATANALSEANARRKEQQLRMAEFYKKMGIPGEDNKE
jgi:hypothetical protein